jgi:adenylate cyclase
MTLSSLQSWLIGEGRTNAELTATMQELGVRLIAAGLDPIRFNVQLRTLHPLVSAQMHIWQLPQLQLHSVGPGALVVEHGQAAFAGAIVQKVDLAHGSFQSETFKRSPLARIYAGAPHFRQRLPITGDELPILKELHREGATDYLALPLVFSAERRGAFSIAIRRPGGFTDSEIDALIALAPALSACFDAHLAAHVARTLLDTYVGRRTGERVLSGRIRSGDVERLEAAIWFSDLRNFTGISSTISPDELVAWLNSYFAAICRPITRHGGEILKFIGDAVLAVFPVGDEAAEACQRALTAAREAHERLAELNSVRAASSLPALRHGVALHLGEVQYGNIGAETRLDFTVIGSAVNLASRLEGLCGKLDVPTVTSAHFAAHAGSGLVSLGHFDLKGIAATQEAFGTE